MFRRDDRRQVVNARQEESPREGPSLGLAFAKERGKVHLHHRPAQHAADEQRQQALADNPLRPGLGFSGVVESNPFGVE